MNNPGRDADTAAPHRRDRPHDRARRDDAGAIPERWLRPLAWRVKIEALSHGLLETGGAADSPV